MKKAQVRVTSTATPVPTSGGGAGVPLRVVLVEDRPADAELIVRELRRAGLECQVERVQEESSLIAALDGFKPDVVLTDHSLPRFSAHEALTVVRRRAPDVPVIVVTGSLEEETAAEYIRAGATDYIVKERLYRLAPAIRRAIELRQARGEQMRTEARFRALIENSADAVVVVGPDQVVQYASPAIFDIFGLLPSAYVGQQVLKRVHPDDLPMAIALLRQAEQRPGATVRHEFRARHEDGSWRVVDLVGSNRMHEPAIGGLVAHLRDVTDQRRAEEGRREADRRFRDLIETAPLGVCQTTVAGEFLVVNRELARLLGYDSTDDLAHVRLTDLYLDPADRADLIGRAIVGGDRHELVTAWRRKDGSTVRVQIILRGVFDQAGRVQFIEGFVRDVTEHESLEAQLRQAQKLEAVGRLAGGVAHDFNNILTAILGSCDLVLAVGVTDPGIVQEVTEIRRAAERAAALTKQLLAFSRRHVVAPQALDLNAVVDEMGGMIRRLIGEDVHLELALAERLGSVTADPGEIEQVVMNLVVNARDAMPTGGRLTIETVDVTVDEAYADAHVGLAPGTYVRLSVTDTGTGIPEAVRAHLFEPFFTTKEAGKGTGLGLAMVYGVIQRSKGHIGVYSEVGRGTTFKLYFPRTGDSPPRVAAATDNPTPTGTERILVVEDEDAVRRVTRRVLEGCGYEVIEASSAEEALRLARSEERAIDLLVTDVVMPGMNGSELADRLLPARPGMRVLFLSGYADDAVFRQGLLDPGSKFLQKPFTVDALGRKVREVLDARGGAPER